MSFPDEQTPDTEIPANAGEATTVDAGTALAEAQARAAEARDRELRAFAELENVRKRSAREVDQARKYAVERFAGELVDVKDSLEMALSAQSGQPGESGNALLAGVEATLKLLNRAFEKAGVTEVVPVGEAFNPELHEAMVTQPTADQAPNTVLQVIQKGYVLNGRLLRPARVIVARAP